MTHRQNISSSSPSIQHRASVQREVAVKKLVKKTVLLASLAALAIVALNEFSEASEPLDPQSLGLLCLGNEENFEPLDFKDEILPLQDSGDRVGNIGIPAGNSSLLDSIERVANTGNSPDNLPSLDSVKLGATANIPAANLPPLQAENLPPVNSLGNLPSLDSVDLEGKIVAPSENPFLNDNALACHKPSERKVERFEPLGPLYEIAEPNLLELFMNRIRSMQQNGLYEERLNQNTFLIGNLLENPPAVQGLGKAIDERTWLLTASIPESLPDELLRQAQQVELPRISRELLFIDGTDNLSLATARTLASKFPDMRVVLTAGSPAEVSKLLDKRIFFDQGGGLIRVFGIEAVPALLFNSPNGPAGLEFPVAETDTILQKYFPNVTSKSLLSVAR